MPVGVVLLERRSREVCSMLSFDTALFPPLPNNCVSPPPCTCRLAPLGTFSVFTHQPQPSAPSPQPPRSLIVRLTRPDLTCYHRAGIARVNACNLVPCSFVPRVQDRVTATQPWRQLFCASAQSNGVPILKGSRSCKQRKRQRKP